MSDSKEVEGVRWEWEEEKAKTKEHHSLSEKVYRIFT